MWGRLQQGCSLNGEGARKWQRQRGSASWNGIVEAYVHGSNANKVVQACTNGPRYLLQLSIALRPTSSPTCCRPHHVPAHVEARPAQSC